MNGYVRGLMFEATGEYGYGAVVVFGYADHEVDGIVQAVPLLQDMMNWKFIGQCWFPAPFLPPATLGETEQLWQWKHIKKNMPHLRVWENGNCC